MVVHVHTVFRLEEHRVWHRAEYRGIAYFSVTTLVALEEQPDDERHLHHADGQSHDHVTPVLLPESRLVKSHDGARRQLALTDAPASQLPGVEHRDGRGLPRRQVGDACAERDAYGTLHRLLPGCSQVRHVATNRAGSDLSVDHRVKRNRRCL